MSVELTFNKTGSSRSKTVRFAFFEAARHGDRSNQVRLHGQPRLQAGETLSRYSLRPMGSGISHRTFTTNLFDAYCSKQACQEACWKEKNARRTAWKRSRWKINLQGQGATHGQNTHNYSTG